MRSYWLLLCIVALALTANLTHVDWGLPGLWHPDEIVGRADAMVARGSLEPRDFAYPAWHHQILIATVVGPARLVADADADSRRSLWVARITPYARAVTALMGAGVVLLTFLVARRFGGDPAGLAAAFVVAASPGFAGLAHFATVDVPSVFWMMLGVWCALRAHESARPRDVFVAALVFGLAGATKYPVGLGVLLVVGSVLVHARAVRTSAGRALLTVGSGACVGFAIGNPYAFLQPIRFAGELIQLSFYQSSYTGEDGRAFGPHVLNLMELSGPLLFALQMAGLVALGRFAWRTRDVRVIGLLAWIALFYLMMGRLQFYPPRYVLPLVPLLAIGVGRLLAELQPRRWPAAVAIVIALSVVHLAVGIDTFGSDDRIVARAWIEENVPADASIEVSPNYGVDLPARYTNVRDLPYAHRKVALLRMQNDPRHRRWREVHRRLMSALGRDVRVESIRMPDEPADATLDSLLARRPAYLVLSERSYDRFLSDTNGAAEHFPRQRTMIAAILDGRTPYREVADFRRTDTWWRPRIGFVDAGVRVFAWERSGDVSASRRTAVRSGLGSALHDLRGTMKAIDRSGPDRAALFGRRTKLRSLAQDVP